MGEIENLWRIHQYENDLEELKNNKNYLEKNKNLEEISVSINEKEYDITNFKTQLEVDKMKMQRLSHKLKEISFEVKEINDKLYSGNTTNVKKLTELQKEEKNLKIKKEELENDILELMENVEINTQKLYDSEKEYSRLNNEYDNYKEQNKIKINNINKQYSELEKELKLLKSSLNKEVLLEFENLKIKKTKPISRLQNDRCRGCHMSIPSSVISKVKRGREIVHCDNCGRILYYDEKTE